MNRKNIIIVISIGIILLGVGSSVYEYREPKTVACTTEAKICPDGSSVGRTGPKCEFAECPAIATTTLVINKGILKGNVTVGPVCNKEVRERFPTYPCTPTAEMYAAAEVFVFMPDKKTLVKTIIPDKYGNFSVSLNEGTYFIDMTHQTMGGTKGVPVTVTISKDKPVVLKLDVDTGLR